MKIVEFFVPGYVQPKQRTIGNYRTPPETRAYELLVRQYASLAMKGKKTQIGPIAVELEITCAVPKSFTKKKREMALTGQIFPVTSDVDNQCKSVLDSMNRVVYEDDRQINRLVAMREYGEVEGVKITVLSLGKA